MPNASEESPGRSWSSNQNTYMGASRSDQSADNFMHGGEVYGHSGRYPTKANLSENYTVLPVGHGNFLKVYHSNESEPPTFNSYELFSSSSIIPPDSVLPQQNAFDNPQFQSNETTNMIINQLVTNWSPNLTGTYSPFGEQGSTANYALNGASSNSTNNAASQPVNKTVGVNNFKANTNGNFGNNSSNMTEVKKRIVAEVKPMRMSYSDVLSKNVAFNSNNSIRSNQTQNFTSLDSSIQLRNSKVNEKGKLNPQAADRKILDEKERNDFKVKKEFSASTKSCEHPSVYSNSSQKDKKRGNLEEKDSSTSQSRQSKKSQDPSKHKNKNFQTSNSNSKKKTNKRDNETGDIKSNSKSSDKEYFYNIAKNDTVGEKYQKTFPHGNLKKRQVSFGQRNSSRTEKNIYTKRIQRQQRDMKYDLVVKFLGKWYEYTSMLLAWLFYLVYDIIVLGFSMLVDWLKTFYCGMCICLVNVRKDFKNNSGKPNVWMRNIFKKIDGKFKKNSKLAFWRSFYKKRLQESVADFYKNGRLPQTGDEAMYSLLNCKGKDAYSILGVSSDSSQEQIRKHYKKIAVLVHPDKNKQPGAEEAFKVLQRAFELIGEPENRKSYDQSLAEALNAEKAWTELHDLLSQLQSKIAEAANTIRCSSCGLRHPRKLTERPHYAARECSSCKISHSAREGDIWAETSVFGLRWKYFALMEGKVYDITEWANCQKGALAHLQPNSHIVQYRIVRGGQQQQQQNLQLEKDRPSNREPPSEPSLDDFLDNLYSGQNPQNQQNSSRRRSRRN